MDIATLVIAVLAFIVSALAFWSSHRSAKAAEEAVAIQREAAKPKVDLRIIGPGKGTIRLANRGEAHAVGIKLADEDQEYVSWIDPLGAVLHAGDSRELMILSPADPIQRLRFTWDGQQEPVYVSTNP